MTTEGSRDLAFDEYLDIIKSFNVDSAVSFSDEVPITIGKNVWIGIASTVLPGVTIGDNSIVGANSVVTHDVPPNTIVAGSPARKIGDVPVPEH